MATPYSMASETEFVTAPSTPEPAHPAAPPALQSQQPPPARPAAAPPRTTTDRLEIVVEQLRQEDGEVGSRRMMTIFRVPAHVRDAGRELYEPRLVSVGPYYRGREALRAMEQHKWRYLRELVALRREASVADYARAVRGVAREARRRYSERTDLFASSSAAAPGGEPSSGEYAKDGHGQSSPPGLDDFGEMLLLDGCFVLQFFIKWHNREKDELCDVGWGLPLLLSDLLLMENQIPFSVLEALFRVAAPEATRLDLLILILSHFKLDNAALLEDLASTRKVPTELQEIHHLLHLLYEAVVPSAGVLRAMVLPAHVSPPPPPRYEVHVRRVGTRVTTAASKGFAVLRDMSRLPRWSGWTRLSSSKTLLRRASASFSNWITAPAKPPAPPPPPMVVPSATQLREAGVRFVRKESPRHMFDIAFDPATGALTMPRVGVSYANKPQLMNLAAFEQTRDDLRGGAGKPVSSYVALLGQLVRTGEDVEHLQKCGVVDNLLDSADDAAARFFQKLGDCSSVDYDDHLFAGVFRELSRYYHSSWRRQKAKFLRDHCSSPWAAVALGVAVFGFCFGIVKFSTTMYNFAHPDCHC